MSLAARKASAELALKVFRAHFEALPPAQRFEALALLQVMVQAEAANTPTPAPAPPPANEEYRS